MIKFFLPNGSPGQIGQSLIVRSALWFQRLFGQLVAFSVAPESSKIVARRLNIESFHQNQGEVLGSCFADNSHTAASIAIVNIWTHFPF